MSMYLLMFLSSDNISVFSKQNNLRDILTKSKTLPLVQKKKIITAKYWNHVIKVIQLKVLTLIYNITTPQ